MKFSWCTVHIMYGIHYVQAAAHPGVYEGARAQLSCSMNYITHRQVHKIYTFLFVCLVTLYLNLTPFFHLMILGKIRVSPKSVRIIWLPWIFNDEDQSDIFLIWYKVNNFPEKDQKFIFPKTFRGNILKTVHVMGWYYPLMIHWMKSWSGVASVCVLY